MSAAAAPVPSLVAASPSSVLTVDQALLEARATGRPVPVEGATTSTDTVTANPSGTLTLRSAVAPVRKRVGGVWGDLDATLVVGEGGRLAARVTTADLSLSGGGAGPLAAVSVAGVSWELMPPAVLPAPTVDGATATYANVLPGVDLVVTADVQGGFSHVWVVRNAAAAANPALAKLVLPVRSKGLRLRADAAGNLAAVNLAGRAILTAPAPRMWDSAAPASVKTKLVEPGSGRVLDAITGRAVASTVDGPGEAARTDRIGVKVTATALELTPPTTLLGAANVTYPVFVDPTWSVTGPTRNGYASVAASFPSSNYWNNTADPDSDNLQVGDAAGFRAHSLLNYTIDSRLTGATINSAELNLYNKYSYSCTATDTNIYAPDATLTPSNATWNYWAGVSLGPVIDHPNFAHGYNGSCPALNVGFNVLAGINAAVAAGRDTQTFLLTGVNETSDNNSWKKFSLSTGASFQIEYNRPPTTPSGLFTSPTTSCPAATPTIVGDASVTLYAPVSDPDGNTVGVTFQLWKTSTPATILDSTDPSLLTYPSGSNAVRVVPESTLKTAAGSAVTQFSWHVSITDGIATTAWSTTCNFTFDPTRTGAPVVPTPADGATTIGTPYTFSVAKPPTGTIPSAYLYQLNGAAPGQVTADASGNASITVTPTRHTNVLTVTSLSAGANVGDAASAVFISTPAGTANDADLTGDGYADVLTVGATFNLPAGLWLASGKNNGQAVPTAANIGAVGNGVFGTNSPDDFTGAQAVTGHFVGTGLQDVFVYYPTGTHAGLALILAGNGDGSPIQADRSGVENTMPSGTLTDANGYDPTQVVNAGNASAPGYAYPDLIGVSGDGTSANSYLAYYPNANGLGAYGTVDQLATKTPTGGTDWNTWTIATTQAANGSTSMFLWQRSTGGLYLWTGLAHPDSATLDHAPQYTIKTSGWNTGAALGLQAADLNTDGTPDLYTVGAAAAGTAWLVTNLATTPAITAQTGQTLSTAKHSWALNNATTGSVGANAAKDTVGTLHLSGATGTTWNTGDLFSPDVAFNGASGSTLTSAAAVTTNADFSLSVWVKPTAVGGTVISQDGTNTAAFTVYTDPDRSWRLAMSRSDVASPTWDIATSKANGVQLGVWTNVTATYKQSTGAMRLYVNGVMVGNTGHTTAWNATGGLRVGDQRTSATTHGANYAGQLANLQLWNQVIEPAQAVTPAGYYQPMTQTRFLDTRYGTGGTTGPVDSGGTVRFKVAGVGGIPATNVTAVALTVVAVGPAAGGYLVVYPENTPIPNTSIVNYDGGATISSTSITAVGSNGYVDIANWGGATQVIADVSGYFTANAAATGNTTYTPLTPARFLDTRYGTGVPAGRIAAGGSVTLQVGGVGGVPSGVKAVAINLTAVAPSTGGYLVAYAGGTTMPSPASGLQFGGTNIAQLAIVPVGTGGAITVASPGASIDLIGDVIGYFTAGTGGLKYHVANDSRILSTIFDGGPVNGQAVKKVPQGNNVVAANPTLVVSVKSVWSTSSGLFQVYPDNIAAPPTSTLNYEAGQTMPNLVLAQTGNGAFDVLVGQPTGTTAQVVVDYFGYFAAS